MPQSQPRAQILSGSNNGNQAKSLPLSMQQFLSSEGIPGAVLSQSRIVNNARASVYNPVSQVSPMVDLSVNQRKELQNYNFSLGSNRAGMSTLSNREMLQEEVNFDIKESRHFPSNYDIFNDLHQQSKSQNWGLQNVGSSFDSSHHPSIQGSQGVPSQLLMQQGISSTHNNGQNRNGPIGKPMYTNGEESGHTNLMGGPQLNSVSRNTLAVKAERFLDADYQSTNFPEQFGQDDLMSAFLKQVSSNLLT